LNKNTASNGSVGLDTLSIKDTLAAVRAAVAADAPIALVGPPGIGKSAIIGDLAKELGLPCEVLILSQCEPVDVGGYPVVKDEGLERLPMAAIKKACEGPVVLFLDELSCAPPAVQGAALRLVYERVAGDVRLHPGTRILVAMNAPEQAAGGWEIALPLLGRLIILELRPSMTEVQDWFINLCDREPEKAALAADFAATLQVSPELLQIDPPPGAQTSGKQWGAPRNWYRGISACSEYLRQGGTDNNQIFTALLAGSVGEATAVSFCAIRKVRHNLPSVSEILKTPMEAKVPENVDAQIAVMGILGQVALTDIWAAWTYTDRIADKDIRAALMNILGKFSVKSEKYKSSKFRQQGQAALTKLLKELGRYMKS
jgi:hypothetical protein